MVCNTSFAESLYSVLGIKLGDHVKNYKISKKPSPNTRKYSLNYMIKTKINNEYFKDEAYVDVDENYKIYNILLFGAKKYKASECQEIKTIIFNLKKDKFIQAGFSGEYQKNKDGTYDSDNDYFRGIDIIFTKIKDNKEIKIIFRSACDAAGKKGINAETDLWVYLRDAIVSEKTMIKLLEDIEVQRLNKKKEDRKKMEQGF